jgi:Peptidase family M23
MTTIAQLFQQSGLWQWFSSAPTQGYQPPVEYGTDFAAAYGTPIGAIAGGTVVANYANPGTSINNQVLISSGSGVWEYQHITSNLQVGQSIAAGSIVGTENGVPTGANDPYSTGPHIEVRYSPTYNPALGIGQNWINPMSAFSSAASADTGPTPSQTGTGSSAVNSIIGAATGGVLPAVTGGNVLSQLGISSINWQDVGIRSGLVIVGLVILIIAIARLLAKPGVVVEEKAS